MELIRPFHFTLQLSFLMGKAPRHRARPLDGAWRIITFCGIRP